MYLNCINITGGTALYSTGALTKSKVVLWLTPLGRLDVRHTAAGKQCTAQ